MEAYFGTLGLKFDYFYESIQVCLFFKLKLMDCLEGLIFVLR